MQWLKRLASRFVWISEDNTDVFYICGADVLPPPLSREEEDALIRRLDDGDEDAKNELAERNLRLVVYIARKFENTGINVEDLMPAADSEYRLSGFHKTVKNREL